MIVTCSPPCLETYDSAWSTLLHENIKYFNEHTEYFQKMLDIIAGKLISLRMIEWFIRNYSKHYYIRYYLNGELGTSRFVVFEEYNRKMTLNGGKKLFDPCCRNYPITIQYTVPDDSNTDATQPPKINQLNTTIGQMNFFRWGIEHKVIDYIQDNLKEIKMDMKHRDSSSRKKSKEIIESETNPITSSLNLPTTTPNSNKTRKKRQEISIAATQTFVKENQPIKIKCPILV
jgi:hypothetical protein